MDFDKWYKEQPILYKFLVLIIPCLGWTIEILYRFSVMMRKPKPVYIIAFILAIIIGWCWPIMIIEVIYMLVTGRLMFTDL